ncbi:type II secretion system protein [Brevifollis gellanilyticus]|nr:type II secretion system protein [Brevifollis gellanilyticus]
MPGFSLMELLIVIAIIGLMANMIIFAWSGHYSEVNAIKDRRNAQTIASLASTASVAGASFVVAGDIPATVDNLAQGTTPTSGVFRNREFKLPPMGTQEITGALNYLQWSGSDLIYKR